MHAIILSIIVPICVAAVWIWPPLRLPEIWLGISGTCLSGMMIWLGMDILRFIEIGGTLQECPIRIVYVLLGATDIPVLQLTLGSFLAGIMSRRQKRAEVTSQPPPLPGMGHSTAETSSTSMTRASDDA